MKKSLLSLVALVFGAGIFCGFASALDISDIFSKDKPLVDTAYTQLLNNYSSDWGYIDNAELTCNTEENGNKAISIVSPKIEDSKFDTAPAYRLFLSPYRISQIKEGDSAIDNSKIIMMEAKAEDNAENVTFNIPSSEFEANTIYYGFITPIDMYDEIGTPSKEVCFQLDKNMCMLDQECDTLGLVIDPTPAEPENNWEEETQESDENTHGAACVGMNLAHVSHVVNGNKIKLTWTAVDGENVDIAIFNPEQEIYEKLATVKMSDEKYVYTMRWDGEQNFMLTNDCGEVRYKADAAVKNKEPEKIVTPATGPAENVLYIAIAAIILYGTYAVFFRKSDNN